ncbi:hypothetical protein [Actinacidiphila glaucinigra]|uniref:hypothetical protein n=1 Tax=Actinacidiphila glaucinigra TaxID=235986 RepID=UPI0037F91C7A
MARVAITTVPVGPNTLEPSGTALTVADGGSFAQTGGEILKLTASGTATVTIPFREKGVDALGNPVVLSRTIAMTAGQTRYVRIDGTFVQPDGLVHVDVSATGVSALVLVHAFVEVGWPVA